MPKDRESPIVTRSKGKPEMSPVNEKIISALGKRKTIKEVKQNRMDGEYTGSSLFPNLNAHTNNESPELPSGLGLYPNLDTRTNNESTELPSTQLPGAAPGTSVNSDPLYTAILREKPFELPERLKTASIGEPVAHIKCGKGSRVIIRCGTATEPYYEYASQSDFPDFVENYPERNVLRMRRGGNGFTIGQFDNPENPVKGIVWDGPEENVTDRYSHLLWVGTCDGQASFELRSFLKKSKRGHTDEILRLVAQESIRRGRSYVAKEKNRPGVRKQKNVIDLDHLEDLSAERLRELANKLIPLLRKGGDSESDEDDESEI